MRAAFEIYNKRNDYFLRSFVIVFNAIQRDDGEFLSSGQSVDFILWILIVAILSENRIHVSQFEFPIMTE